MRDDPWSFGGHKVQPISGDDSSRAIDFRGTKSKKNLFARHDPDRKVWLILNADRRKPLRR
jgi:hypothetical protein